MASKRKLIKQLITIEKECKHNKKLNDELEKYVLNVGEPTTEYDAIQFIKKYERVKASIKTTG